MAVSMRSVAGNQAADGGLSCYLQRTKLYPMLTSEREQEVSRAWRDHRDPAALEELVGSHLRLAVKAARGFAGYGLPISDLIAEGNVGLLQAAEKFDPDRGFRFATYATWWIRAAIQEYILHSWSLVKMGTTAAQKKLFFNLRRMKSDLRELDQGDLAPESVAAIATKLDVPQGEVIEMNRRLGGGDSSLNRPMGADGESDWIELLADDRASPETQVIDADEKSTRGRMLSTAMTVLNARERRILEARRLSDEPVTLEDLGREFSVSRERIRQIEARAFEKLQKAMLDAVAANQSRPSVPFGRAARANDHMAAAA